MWNRHLPSLHDKSIAVDFGTGWGKSASAIKLCNPKLRVISFDDGLMHVKNREAADIGDYEKKVRTYIEQAGAEVEFSVADSETEEIYDISFLNIDTSHEYDDVKKALRTWVPRIRYGGLLSFHDYAHPKFPESSAAFVDYLQERHPASSLKLIDVAIHDKIVAALFKKIVV